MRAERAVARPGESPAAGASSDGWEHVARIAELEGRGLLGVSLRDGTRVCLIQCGDAVTAVRDLCTHQAFPLSEGELVNGRLLCAWHGAEFDCATGRVCRGPATEDLGTFDVRVVGQDIHVRAR